MTLMQHFVSKLRVLIIASLVMVVGCVPGAEHDNASVSKAAVSNTAGLRPYLGRWVPTSFAEERNIVSLTISETALSIQTGGVLTFVAIKQVEQALIVQAIDHELPPAEASFALGLRLEREPPTNSAAKQESARELLRIYWCDSIEDLSGTVEQWQCSKNAYVRRATR